MPMKIFDLAKELDIRAIDLVEKLKAEGFSVRNHMATLTDEDVVKARAVFVPVAIVPAKKKTKRKVTKKAAAKKVTKSSADKPTEKVVRRRAATKEEETNVESPAVEKAVAQKVESDGKVEALAEAEVKKDSSTVVVRRKKKDIEAAKCEDDHQEMKESFGLKVVSRPEVVVPVAEPTEAAQEVQESSPVEAKSELFDDRPKVHKFTPVFIPEPKTEKEKEEDAVKEAAKQQGAGVAGQPADKSKVGNLAAMMSKGRGATAAVSKTRNLTQMRADEEMKQYALNSLGRPLYKQVGRKKMYSGPSKQTRLTDIKDSKRIISIHNAVTALDLAKKLKIKFKELRDKCLDLNLLVKQEDYFGEGIAAVIAGLYKYGLKNDAFDEKEILEAEVTQNIKSDLPLRDPIITIMGHVDHGKTTLLDHIRDAKVAAGEAGGITQHIGAYKVQRKEHGICFLDTPGHAAFGAMRQRGADITDIVILVVAADDGVMPQTKESIKYCQNAGVPIIVAVNKCDKDEAKPDKIKQELVEFELTPEEWGGDTMYCNISALKGDGIDDLLDQILLLAEVLELHEDPKGKASGLVIEAQVEQGRGPVATILVQKGSLKQGDSIVVGETYGRARSLLNPQGDTLKNAGPSTPVQIFGLADAPSPGDSFHVVKNEREAKKICENRVKERKDIENVPQKAKVSLEDFFGSAVEENEKRVLNLIIRSDVQGSFEAIKNSLEALGNEEVGVKVVTGGVGAITESDINLAISSGAVVFGFNMRPLTAARRLAEAQEIEVKTYSVIYELIDDVTLALEGLLDPEISEEFIGRAEVRETFSIPKIGTIAGTSVIDGKIERGCNIRLLRDGKIMHDGKLNSLKRFKDDVKEVGNGFECGMGLEGYNDIKIGDQFEAYILNEKKRTLSDLESAPVV